MLRNYPLKRGALVLAMFVLLCAAIAVCAEGTDAAPQLQEEQTETIKAEDNEETLAPTPVYTLAFLAYTEDVLYSEQLKEGDTIIAPFFIPMRDGYTFLFWYDQSAANETGGVVPFQFNGQIERDTVLLPHYEALPSEEETVNEAPVLQMPWDVLTSEPETPPQTLVNGEPVIGMHDDLLGNASVFIIEDPEDEETGPEGLEESANNLLEGCEVRVFSSHSDCIDVGATIELWAELIGFDSADANLQWQYFDGAWHDVPGATGTSHTFTATAETVNYGWRLAATLK